jgi:hypothetical protein
MARFVQVKSGKETFEKCIDAIETVGRLSGELWLKSFLEEAEKTKKMPETNVLLHDYRLFKDESIKWEYIANYSNEASWEYENSDGVNIYIKENKFGRSEVIKSAGLSEDLVQKLNNINNEQLYDIVDMEIIPKYFKDSSMDLRIIDNK